MLLTNVSGLQISGFAEIRYSNIASGSPCIGSDIRSDIEADIGSYLEISTDNFSFCQVLLPGTNRVIAMDEDDLSDYLDQDPDIPRTSTADLGPYARFLH